MNLNTEAANAGKASLEQIENEHMVSEVEVALAAAETDPESLDACDKRLRDLKVALDQVEGTLQWPNLLREAEDMLARARELIDERGSLEDKRNFQSSEDEIHKAMQTHNADLLEQRVGALHNLIIRVLDKQDILPAIVFEQLCAMKNEMREQAQAQKLMEAGLRAVQTRDIRTLRSINQQLRILLPASPPPIDISTLMR